jgi:RimJ/RimL family protein N-acetyltransferase
VHECPVDHPALPALFDPTVPNSPVLWSVLKGRNTGRALGDSIQDPSQCVIRTDAVLTFFSRQIGQAFLHEAIAHLRQTEPVWLVWPSMLVPEPFLLQDALVVQRLEFYDCDPGGQALADWRRRLPAGFEIRAIDRPLLERCEWRSEMEFYCGSLDNFLANGIGTCLMRGDDIIVEAYASSLGGGRAEIGAVTRAAYRGQGYAPIACAYLIEACEERGCQPNWSCDIDNEASIRVARKLGFRQERAYQILEYGPRSANMGGPVSPLLPHE